MPIRKDVQEDERLRRYKDEALTLKRKNRELLRQLSKERKLLASVEEADTKIRTYKILPTTRSKDSEATAVAV